MPVPYYTTPYTWYIDRPFQLVGRRCLEHGINQALQSISYHSMALKSAREVNILVAGLALALLVFIGELVSVLRLPVRMMHGISFKLKRLAELRR